MKSGKLLAGLLVALAVIIGAHYFGSVDIPVAEVTAILYGNITRADTAVRTVCPRDLRRCIDRCGRSDFTRLVLVSRRGRYVRSGVFRRTARHDLCPGLDGAAGQSGLSRPARYGCQRLFRRLDYHAHLLLKQRSASPQCEVLARRIAGGIAMVVRLAARSDRPSLGGDHHLVSQRLRPVAARS